MRLPDLFRSRRAASPRPMHCFCASSLLREHQVHFYSKASFVDPRPAVGDLDGFRFFDTTNTGPDQLRQRLSRIPVASFLSGQYDAATYTRLLVSEMARRHATEKYELSLWLGEFARGKNGRCPGGQLCPGASGHRCTVDPSSLCRNQGAGGAGRGLQMASSGEASLIARGVASAEESLITLSSGARSRAGTLQAVYGVRDERIFTLPYPIDLQMFRTDFLNREVASQSFATRMLVGSYHSSEAA